MTGWSPRCYIPSFVKIGLPVPEKILEGFLPYGHGDHLGHVTGQHNVIKFKFFVPENFLTKFGSDRHSSF